MEPQLGPAQDVCTHTRALCVHTHRKEERPLRRPSALAPAGKPGERRQLRDRRERGGWLRSSRSTRKKKGSVAFSFSSLPPYIEINVVDDWFG